MTEPQPISTAPGEVDAPLLLFCPKQGGWHVGVRFGGKWYAYIGYAYIDPAIELEPSHWLPTPPDPPGIVKAQDSLGAQGQLP
jgi:hypothetical protein